jgi:hypothetical protein
MPVWTRILLRFRVGHEPERQKGRPHGLARGPVFIGILPDGRDRTGHARKRPQLCLRPPETTADPRGLLRAYLLIDGTFPEARASVHGSGHEAGHARPEKRRPDLPARGRGRLPAPVDKTEGGLTGLGLPNPTGFPVGHRHPGDAEKPTQIRLRPSQLVAKACKPVLKEIRGPDRTAGLRVAAICHHAWNIVKISSE